MANQFSSNLKSLTTKAITAPMRALPHLFVIAAALFLFVGTVHAQAGPCPPGQFPCILVSDASGTHQIKVYPDAGGGTPLNATLLGSGGGGGGEGVACLSGGANVLYVANNSGFIDVYSMNLINNRAPFQWAYQASGSIAGLATNTMFLYAAEGNAIGSFTPLPSSPFLLEYNPPTSDSDSHDVWLGVCPPNVPSCGYGGYVFTTLFTPTGTNTGVREYMPDSIGLTLPGPVQFLPGIPVSNNSNCAVFSGHTHCWSNLAGGAFDPEGNLWVNQAETYGQDGTFEFAPGGTCGAPVCPLNFTTPNGGSSSDPVGLTVAPAGDPAGNAGKILTADYLGSEVDIIDPISCTGSTLTTPWTLGICHSSSFISDSGNPKYVVYSQACPNPDNNGYVEICKQSNPNYPVTGTFDFMATAPFFNSGTIQVPVGECSGPVEVPSGQVTVTETPTIGDLVSDVTACSYNEFGECVPDLISWTLPDLYATVPVATGGVSSETLTTFTNYAAFPGQLKVCKIAGLGTPVGTEFTFTVTGIPSFQVQAGPPSQGGFCQLVAGTFPVNTPVTIAETPNASYPLTNVTDECNACTYSINLPQSSMTTTIGAGITVVSFTNTKSGGKQTPCLACNNQ